MPSNCTKYAVGRLQSESNRVKKTNENEPVPHENLRARFFYLCDNAIPLPENRSQYTAMEACAILHEVQNWKSISINKVIDFMINYKVTSSHNVTSLIPVTRSVMYRVYNKYKGNGEACWPTMGRPPILKNDSFMSSIKKFEKDENRAISKKDMCNILKEAKSEVAKEKGNSTTMVATPTKRSLNNHISLLPQLDP